jgi:hypothetical protein
MNKCEQKDIIYEYIDSISGWASISDSKFKSNIDIESFQQQNSQRLS